MRRSNKPIMEKRRRARINNCLNDLKTLILEAMKKDPSRHSKLEKADILEMTVKYLQSLQRQQMALAVATDPNVLSKYRAGFNECANEVSRFVSRSDYGVEPAIRTRLLNHLSSCLNALGATTNAAAAANSVSLVGATGAGAATPLGTPVHIQIPGGVGGVSPGGVDLVGGIQLVPSRLPSGEIAFLLPSSQAQGQIIPLYSPSPSTSSSTSSFSSSSSSHKVLPAGVPLSVMAMAVPPSPVSSNTSTLSPVGSDFSEASRGGTSPTPVSSPACSTHSSHSHHSHHSHSSHMSQCLPSPESSDQPENLSLYRDAVDNDRMWRPW